MGPVVHLAFNSDGAGAGLSGKGSDNGFRLFDFRRRGGEHLVDHGHLRGMNGKAPRKSIAARGLGITTQAFRIAEVDIHGLDRRKLCRGCGKKADRARKTIGFGQVVPVRHG